MWIAFGVGWTLGVLSAWIGFYCWYYFAPPPGDQLPARWKPPK